MTGDYFQKGWACFEPEPAVRDWARYAAHYAKNAVHTIENKNFHQCERTWFIGLDVLPNDAEGRVEGGCALSGKAVDFATQNCGGWPALHRAQISVMYPGYPKPRLGESDAGFRYRVNRDAAHVDGIIGVGTPKRRFVQEPHAFIMGIPLTQASVDAAPLVVWEGSHYIMRAALQHIYAGLSEADATTTDITGIYIAARREVFETCPRVPLCVDVGATVLLHRLTLHGVAPWDEGATADPDGRMIAYFRPKIAGGIAAWLSSP
ncbi:hypothetical protein ROLI_014700 [Roseobacter fucihabitans]|uniref:Uncharacterized protein n=1 Tax=Roseobacter fucihabitans TaxID=1537242 RepID=A0ABZ2BSH3_9RHOB|nr:hypothetical protein [Roseobacter litoralis]MBC6968341.1 hypothetical protein [Roseobacter litoralis]